MLVYILLFAVVVLTWGLDKLALHFGFDKKHPYLYTVIFTNKTLILFLIIMFATIRAESVGADNSNYIKYFNSVAERRPCYDYGVGYAGLNFIITLLGMPINVLWFVITSFTVYSFNALFNEYSNNTYICWLLFFALGIYAQMLGLYRQILALDFCVLGLIWLRRNDILVFLIYVILGFFFHLSALIALFYVIPKYVKLNWRTGIIAISIMIMLGILIVDLLRLLEDYFPQFSYYSQYVAMGWVASSSRLDIPYAIGVAIILAVACFAYFKMQSKMDKKQQQDFSFFIWLFAVYVFTKIVGIPYNLNALFNRTSMYFFFSIIFIAEMLGGLLKRKNLKVMYNIALIVVAFCYMYFLIKIKGSCGVYPYAVMKIGGKL